MGPLSWGAKDGKCKNADGESTSEGFFTTRNEKGNCTTRSIGGMATYAGDGIKNFASNTKGYACENPKVVGGVAACVAGAAALGYYKKDYLKGKWNKSWLKKKWDWHVRGETRDGIANIEAAEVSLNLWEKFSKAYKASKSSGLGDRPTKKQIEETNNFISGFLKEVADRFGWKGEEKKEMEAFINDALKEEEGKPTTY